jgi:pSer/pThr/pTyr-binding forkhead associated (FHA) protein
MLVDRQRSYPLQVGANTIGRLPDNDVVVEDADVSRRHCAILIHASQRCEVHDTASKNGTFVNGRRIFAPTDLKAGDEIQMCTRRLVLLAAGDHGLSQTFYEAGPHN